ncbi:MAG: hypothetical protein DKM50_04550 [Candidatus Margulisiibacteriota bacterium]|nr:MAG: hypothetical protein A2X43_05690 [Candidatus Margulisbacteria bacterium GWD2_39_127]OGI01046.1 MAG: hypothetical protein A2X42_12330 [Candidatus Margulisbacteria bacterium GWF2_38_17]OGI09575.1 MAG: hypothetical protein A2X41_06535 [Candidatus Margulisbacteria bacterium GWE2_39_32]PZM82021.1 MAG: hypothetical protein DKM50_04550 [Candidatus Margulisiibacteriota bacterium]HCY35858.1 hypothetical protein [Candidatus Margulisiibacteriota bacterium]
MDEFNVIKKIKFGDGETTNFLFNADKINYIEHPFQKFLDYAVDSLSKTSISEIQTNMTLDNYAAGKASLEEVMFSENRTGIQINMAVTAINNVVSSFKEIQQMPI